MVKNPTKKANSKALVAHLDLIQKYSKMDPSCKKAGDSPLFSARDIAENKKRVEEAKAAMTPRKANETKRKKEIPTSQESMGMSLEDQDAAQQVVSIAAPLSCCSTTGRHTNTANRLL